MQKDEGHIKTFTLLKTLHATAYLQKKITKLRRGKQVDFESFLGYPVWCCKVIVSC